MKVFFVLTLVLAAQVDGQFWKYSQQLFNPFAWIRQPKTSDTKATIHPHTLGSSSATTSNVSPTQTPIPLSFPPSIPSSPRTEIVESKMGEIPLNQSQPPTQPPITTTNAKSPRTTLSERSTTKRALKNKSTSSPHPHASSYSNSPYYTHSSHPTYSHSHSHSPSSQSTKQTSPIWTTVPITTQTSNTRYHHSNNHKNNTEKTVTSIMHNTGNYGYTQSQLQSQPASHVPLNANSISHVSGTTTMFKTVGTSSAAATATVTEATTDFDTTTQEATGTTEEPRDNHRQHDFYLSKREKPQVKIASNISQNLLPLPAGASAALVKPTKYHYYPHNQHIYLLPECAIQQVCNAVYVRLNWTQPLCACPSRYRDPCSASLNSDDQHTTELQIDRNSKRALTLVKTCEPTSEMRICRSPRDWSLLALQNIRTGKSHYLVICRCPDTSILEGPMSHDQPTYASVPGIRVYGMMCVQAPQSNTLSNKRRGRPLRLIRRSLDETNPPFPWDKAIELAKTADWEE